MNIRCADSADYTDLVARGHGLNIKELGVFLYPYLTETEYRERYDWLQFLQKINHVPTGKSLYEEVLRYAVLSRQIAREEKFDIIHAHDWLSFPAGLEAKRISGKKLVAHVHATEIERTGGSVNKNIYNIEKECLRQADQIITVGGRTRDIVADNYGVTKDKIEVVHNGIDHDYFENVDQGRNRLLSLKKTGHRLVLFSGRLTIQKGPDYFIRAAQKALTIDPKIYFLIFGAGDMKNKLMHLAAGLGISDKVLFGDWLRGPDLVYAYQAADLYVMSSVFEPFGIMVLEAMMNRTPVLVSKQAGAVEAVKNILTVDFWDTDEMADKIVFVLSHGQLHKHLAENGREEVKKITWEKAADKCINLYQSLIKNPACSPA